MRLQDAIRKAIELGHRTGAVTFDQLNELLPSATTEPEDIEVVMQALSDEGINLIEDDQS
ncbi:MULTISPECIES: RNA polymerase sigma factor region1.1 domain-containing protein [Bradyrhizobium]|uniref:RNA polymerase sigma factor region1.1 domain-containing protein n=1 Tax=Bradyrhizobium TaxID=374 RepID=UPI001B8A314D|nr:MULTISPECIES: RNA polymerase sigma factor region1.1 domain-containing protein [Bradyrhizobium]MBR0974678.1 RNA polymerase subunit sigma-70 [Bradyrhizobium japonicum]